MPAAFPRTLCTVSFAIAMAFPGGLVSSLASRNSSPLRIMSYVKPMNTLTPLAWAYWKRRAWASWRWRESQRDQVDQGANADLRYMWRTVSFDRVAALRAPPPQAIPRAKR